MLDGPGLIWPPGAYAFIDSNAMDGVGVVFVEQGLEGSPSVQQHA
jgi:hypothetical protein